MRWPLRNQIFTPLATILLVVLAGASLLDALLAARRTERQIARQLQGIADTLRSASFPLTDSVLHQMRGLSGAEFVLTDVAGRTLAASDRRPLPNNLAVAAPGATAGDFGPAVEMFGARYFHGAVAVHQYAEPGEPAVLHVLYPERIWREARWQAAWPPLAVGAVALALVAVLALWLAARLALPIRRLGAQVAGLARGDFRTLPLPAKDDEVRDLAASVNCLAGQLNELREAIRRTERLMLLGQLTGGLVHRLRNDVAGARIAVQLHERQCHGADTECLTVALRQLALTEEHLQRFLAAGALRPVRSATLDLHTVVGNVVDLLGPTCRHRKVDLQLQLADQPVILSADADQLSQLLLNLVLNGLAAAGNGGWVRVETMLVRQSVRLRVLDSGPGPPPALRNKVFEPFVTGKPDGIGLGLAAVQQIAAAHGGSVRLLGEPPTCFEVVLPRDPQVGAACNAATAVPSSTLGGEAA